jgi:hypothetical protein
MTEMSNIEILSGVLNDVDPAAEFHAIDGLMPAEANQSRNAFTAATSRIRMEVNGAVHAVNQLRANDMIPEEGRRRLIAERMAKAEQAVAEELPKVDAALHVLDAQLANAAMAPVQDPGLGRMDAAMILDGASPDQLDSLMARLAARQDDVGAIVASTWGADYLRSRGIHEDLVTAMHAAVRVAAVDAATTSTDRNRAAAAEHHRGLVHLRQARDTVANGASSVLSELRGR